MAHELEEKLKDAVEKNDIELAHAVLTLGLLSSQINNALKVALVLSRKIEKKFQKAFVEDAVEIEGKVNEMFEVLAGYLELRKKGHESIIQTNDPII